MTKKEIIEIVERGSQGPQGLSGTETIEGGTTGQVLTKISDNDFDVDWVDPIAGDGDVPVGGTVGQHLAKVSSTDYDTEWVDVETGIPDGGTTGQHLAKTSNADGDVEWVDVDDVGIPDGGTTGQILAKTSNADGDADWIAPTNSMFQLSEMPAEVDAATGQYLEWDSAIGTGAFKWKVLDFVVEAPTLDIQYVRNGLQGEWQIPSTQFIEHTSLPLDTVISNIELDVADNTTNITVNEVAITELEDRVDVVEATPDFYGVEGTKRPLITLDSANAFSIEASVVRYGTKRVVVPAKLAIPNPLVGSEDVGIVGVCAKGDFVNPDPSRYSIISNDIDTDIVVKRSDFNAVEFIAFTESEMTQLCRIGGIRGSSTSLSASNDTYAIYSKGLTPSDIVYDSVKLRGGGIDLGTNILQLYQAEGTIIDNHRDENIIIEIDGVPMETAYRDGASGYNITYSGTAYTFGSGSTNTAADHYDDGSGTLVQLPNTEFTIHTILGHPANSSRLWMVTGTEVYIDQNSAFIALQSKAPDYGPWVGGTLYPKAFVVYKGSDLIAAISNIQGSSGGGGGTGSEVNLGVGTDADTVTITTDTGGSPAVIQSVNETDAGVMTVDLYDKLISHDSLNTSVLDPLAGVTVNINLADMDREGKVIVTSTNTTQQLSLENVAFPVGMVLYIKVGAPLNTPIDIIRINSQAGGNHTFNGIGFEDLYIEGQYVELTQIGTDGQTWEHNDVFILTDEVRAMRGADLYDVYDTAKTDYVAGDKVHYSVDHFNYICVIDNATSNQNPIDRPDLWEGLSIEDNLTRIGALAQDAFRVADKLAGRAKYAGDKFQYIHANEMSEEATNYVLQCIGTTANIVVDGNRVLPNYGATIAGNDAFGFFGGNGTDPTDPSATLIEILIPSFSIINGYELSVTASSSTSSSDPVDQFVRLYSGDPTSGGLELDPIEGDTNWIDQGIARTVTWTLNVNSVAAADNEIRLFVSKQYVRDISLVVNGLVSKVAVLENSTGIIYGGTSPEVGSVGVTLDGDIVSVARGGGMVSQMTDIGLSISDTAGITRTIDSPIENFAGMGNTPADYTDWRDLSVVDPDGNTISITVESNSDVSGLFGRRDYQGHSAGRGLSANDDSFNRHLRGLKPASIVRFRIKVGDDGAAGGSAVVQVTPTGCTDNTSVSVSVPFNTVGSIDFTRVAIGSDVSFNILLAEGGSTNSGRIWEEQYSITANYGNDLPPPRVDSLITLIGERIETEVAIETNGDFPIARAYKIEYDNTLTPSLVDDVQGAVESLVRDYGFGSTNVSGTNIPNNDLDDIETNGIYRCTGTTNLPAGWGSATVTHVCFGGAVMMQTAARADNGSVVEIMIRKKNTNWQSWILESRADHTSYDNTATPALSADNVQAAIVEVLNEHGGAGNMGATTSITNINNLRANGCYTSTDNVNNPNATAFCIVDHKNYNTTDAIQIAHIMDSVEQAPNMWIRYLDNGADWGNWRLIFGGNAGVPSGAQAPQLIGYATFDPSTMANDTSEVTYRGRGNNLITVHNTASTGVLTVTTGSSVHSDIAGRYQWVINDERIIPQGGVMSKFMFTGWSGANVSMSHKYFDGSTFTPINYSQNANSYVTVELWQNY